MVRPIFRGAGSGLAGRAIGLMLGSWGFRARKATRLLGGGVGGRLADFGWASEADMATRGRCRTGVALRWSGYEWAFAVCRPRTDRLYRPIGSFQCAGLKQATGHTFRDLPQLAQPQIGPFDFEGCKPRFKAFGTLSVVSLGTGPP
jgi:hypothetical protein